MMLEAILRISFRKFSALPYCYASFSCELRDVTAVVVHEEATLADALQPVPVSARDLEDATIILAEALLHSRGRRSHAGARRCSRSKAHRAVSLAHVLWAIHRSRVYFPG